MNDPKLQGSLEYLLLIGGGVIIAIVVILFIISAVTDLAAAVKETVEESPVRCIDTKILKEDIGNLVVMDPNLNNPLILNFNLPTGSDGDYTILKAQIVWDSSEDWQTEDFCKDSSGNDAECWHCFWIDVSNITATILEPEPKEVEISGISFLEHDQPHYLYIKSGINSSCDIGNENDDFTLQNVELELEVCGD